MDFRELLSVADHNKSEASYEASVKRFTTELPPPKKVSKNGVMSDNIAKFLAKRKVEEAARAAEARKQKEQLLAIRAQNSKNSKKAKIMASRTKDNDFSKIKLTDDEVEAKRKREAQLIRQNLSNKVERMKARIELEEKEKLLPKKRKRKTKNGEYVENHDDYDEVEPKNECRNLNDLKSDNKKTSEKNNQSRKALKSAAPVISFAELLKVAEKKQYEPVEVIPKKKDEEKPLTKKEKKLLIEEKERERRKKERLLMGDLGTLKPNGVAKTNIKTTSVSSKKIDNNKGNPVVIRVEKDNSKQSQQSNKLKIPRNTTSVPHSTSQFKCKETAENVNKSNINKSCVNKSTKLNISEKNMKSRDERTGQMVAKNIKKPVSKSNGVKSNSASSVPSKPPAPQIDEEAITAAIEKRIREKIEKELEQKLMSKFGLLNNNPPSQPDKDNMSKTASTSKPTFIKKDSPALTENSKKPLNKLPVHSKKDIERFIAMKKQAMEQKRLASRPPEKKPFHFNPYLDPPRRLLEPQIRRPPQQRIESSDEDDDDDLSDFIDDGPTTQNEENYSQYIKEIFGYDKNKYMDEDEDVEAMESSFAQQMKEEIESAKAGIREDLEEERKEMERRKRKKLKKK